MDDKLFIVNVVFIYTEVERNVRTEKGIWGSAKQEDHGKENVASWKTWCPSFSENFQVSELELTRNIAIFQNPLWKKYRRIPVLVVRKSQREWGQFVIQINIYSFKFCWCVSLLFFEVTPSCSLLLFPSYIWDLSGV